MMRGRTFFATLAAVAMCASLASGQSLVELAKKEKARRAGLKGKKTIVVTNADLKRTGKKPAVKVSRAPSPKANPVPPREKSRAIPVVPEKRANPDPKGHAPADAPEDLELKHRQAVERISLLTLKMNALWQRYYSLDNMQTRDGIQQEIRQTYLQLGQAKSEAAELKERIDRNRTRRRSTGNR